MPINVTMPALSPTMTDGTLAKWHVKEGDTVEAGDVIAEINGARVSDTGEALRKLEAGVGIQSCSCKNSGRSRGHGAAPA